MSKRRTPLTEELAREIKRLAKLRPDLPQHDIAALLGLNQGRVSEVLNGKRFPEA
jgi:predicted XRE-type DNA-binding protein